MLRAEPALREAADRAAQRAQRTAREKPAYDALWIQADRDRNGTLDVQELQQFFSRAGVTGPQLLELVKLVRTNPLAATIGPPEFHLLLGLLALTQRGLPATVQAVRDSLEPLVPDLAAFDPMARLATYAPAAVPTSKPSPSPKKTSPDSHEARYCTAIGDWPGDNPGDLPLTNGAQYTIVDDFTEPEGWWQIMSADGTTGYAPSTWLIGMEEQSKKLDFKARSTAEILKKHLNAAQATSLALRAAREKSVYDALWLQADNDRNGTLDVQELQQFFTRAGVTGPQLLELVKLVRTNPLAATIGPPEFHLLLGLLALTQRGLPATVQAVRDSLEPLVPDLAAFDPMAGLAPPAAVPASKPSVAKPLPRTPAASTTPHAAESLKLIADLADAHTRMSARLAELEAGLSDSKTALQLDAASLKQAEAAMRKHADALKAEMAALRAQGGDTSKRVGDLEDQLRVVVANQQELMVLTHVERMVAEMKTKYGAVEVVWKV